MSDMTPSTTITDGQIEKAINVFRSELQKRSQELGADAVQQMLGEKDLGPALFKVIRDHVEIINEMIVRTVKNIDRGLSRKDAVEATNRNFYGDHRYAENFPDGTSDCETVTFIPLQKSMSPDAVDSMVAAGGWQYASLHAIARHNQDNPDFANEVPHFIQGKDEENRHSCAAFSRWDDGRDVDVFRSEDGWSDDWFVVVVPAS